MAAHANRMRFNGARLATRDGIARRAVALAVDRPSLT